jgi:pyrroline-5-carboxylate reductase
MKTATIAIIGGGNMGTSLVGGLITLNKTTE